MDDLIYNELVASPGFEIEFAVGTTYSMDAEAFLAVSLSMANLGEAADADSPARLLAGLRNAASKVAIFINRGGLQVPPRRSPLYAMLDRCVFEVADEHRGNELANFHPKLWIIREHAIDEPGRRELKLIVLSRNLTKDTSLDIAASMVAPLGARPSDVLRRKHAPLKEMLLQLATFASGKKAREVRNLAGDIDSLGAFSLSDPYADYEFIPIMFGANLNPDINFERELPATLMAVVSPFVDLPALQWLNSYAPKAEKVLITRLESLTPEIMDLYAGELRSVWVPTQLMALNDVQPMNLHAKMYFSWHPRSGGVHLWLGSANATASGFYRNSEFLLRLTMRRGVRRFDNFVREFTDEKKQMFRRLTSLPPQPREAPRDLSLSVAVRVKLISRNNLSAEVVCDGEEHQVRIRARRLPDIPGQIKFAPIQEPYNEAPMTSTGCTITVTHPASLSEFYILSVTPEAENVEPVRMVIKIPTAGIPADRDNLIFQSIINTPARFRSFIEMMITDRPRELLALLDDPAGDSAGAGSNSSDQPRGALYESLLRLLAGNPAKLKDIQEVVSMAGDSVVSESFRRMADVFYHSAKQLR